MSRPNLAYHKLDIYKDAKPTWQKPRRMIPDRKEKVNKDIKHLLEDGTSNIPYIGTKRYNSAIEELTNTNLIKFH